MRYQEAAEEEELEQMIFSESLGQQQPKKRRTSEGAKQSRDNGSFEPSGTESSEGDPSDSDTNLFSIASKFPTDSNLPGSCLINDDEEPHEDDILAGSLDFQDKQLKKTLLMLRQQLKTQNESDLKIEQLKKKNEEQEDELFKLREENGHLRKRVSSLQSTVSSLNSQVSQMQHQMDVQQAGQKDSMKKSHLDLENDLIEKQNQIIVLKDKIINLMKNTSNAQKSHRVYVPNKLDEIDCTLGRFLNTMGKRLKVPFIRESEGLYRFGSKKVVLYLERGDELHVRISGRYLTIQQFIDQFTKAEVDKMERQNALSTF
jgi:hypothetical protein